MSSIQQVHNAPGVSSSCADVMCFMLARCSYLEYLRSPYYGVPLNVSFTRAALCFLLSLATATTSFALFAILGAIKLAPVLVRSIYLYAKLLRQFDLQKLCLWGPFWLMGLGFVPVGVLLVFVFVLLSPWVYIGPISAIRAYHAEG